MRTAKIATLPGLVALALAAAFALTAGDAGGQAPRAPRSFFGIAPQSPPSDTDAEYMRAGGIGSVRWPVPWDGVQPSAKGGYQWDGIDAVVATAARRRLAVLPFLYATPSWLAPKYTALPVASARQRRAWVAFVRAAVARYGPRGSFWRQHGPRSDEPLPKTPIRTWQIWNEANFFYFAFPVSVSRYAQTLRLANRAVKAVDPGAKVLLSGLFGVPDQRGRRGMPAVKFLEALYRVRGIKSDFDEIALHPYAVDAEDLEELTREMREVVVANHDPGAGLYITEMGWGSQSNFRQVAFEQGLRGQVRQLRDSYRFLLRNRRRLNLKGAYWFSWQDLEGSCNFCDSVGLFRAGERLRPKPAWHAFVRLANGRPRP
jgi:hypothetical protein